jgi:O-antigen ligase
MLEQFKSQPWTTVVSLLLLATIFFIPISSSLKSVFIVLSTIGLLLTPTYRSKLLIVFSQPWCKATLLLFITLLLACLWSPSSYHTQFLFIEKYSKLLYLPILTTGFQNKKIRHVGLRVFLVAMFFICVLSIIKDIHQAGSADRLFHDHISTSFMMAFATYLSGLLAIKHSGTQRILYSLLVLVFSYQVLFVNSGRMGYVLYFMLMLLLLIQNLPVKYMITGVLCLSTLFIVTAYQSTTFSNRLIEAKSDWNQYQHGIKNSSISGRIMFHQYAKSLFLSSPWIGHGTGSFSLYFQKYNKVPTFNHLMEPHSQYWLIASETGLLGLAALFYFYLSLFLSALRLNEAKPIMLGLLVCFFISNFSDSQLLHSDVGYLFIVFSALCLSELVFKPGFSRTKIRASNTNHIGLENVL